MPYVFTNTGAGPVVNMNYLNEKLDERCALRSIGKCTICEERARPAAKAQVPAEVIEAALNHRSGTFRRHRRLSISATTHRRARGRAARWSDYIDQLVAGKPGKRCSCPASGAADTCARDRTKKDGARRLAALQAYAAKLPARERAAYLLALKRFRLATAAAAIAGEQAREAKRREQRRQRLMPALAARRSKSEISDADVAAQLEQFKVKRPHCAALAGMAHRRRNHRRGERCTRGGRTCAAAPTYVYDKVLVFRSRTLNTHFC